MIPFLFSVRLIVQEESWITIAHYGPEQTLFEDIHGNYKIWSAFVLI